jgi:hypothetical protein
MNRALLAATVLIASGFTPIAPPVLVGAAAASPSPNVLLCTDTSLLGPSGNGHFWGSPYILPARNIVTGTLGAPTRDGAGVDHYSGTAAVSLQAVIQRCPVVNRSGQPTGKYQDVEIIAAHHTTFGLECEHTPPDSVPPPYLSCHLEAPTGGSGEDR